VRQVRAAMKFQFRDLETFIHPDHIDDPSNRHVKRFKSTKLTKAEFSELLQASRDAGVHVFPCACFRDALLFTRMPQEARRVCLEAAATAPQGLSRCARLSTRRAST
jgi:hypothetical protein